MRRACDFGQFCVTPDVKFDPGKQVVSETLFSGEG